MLTELLLQCRERAVIPDRDRTDGPPDRAEVPRQEAGPPGGCMAPEDHDRQIAEVGDHHEFSQGGVQHPHTEDGTFRR